MIIVSVEIVFVSWENTTFVVSGNVCLELILINVQDDIEISHIMVYRSFFLWFLFLSKVDYPHRETNLIVSHFVKVYWAAINNSGWFLSQEILPRPILLLPLIFPCLILFSSRNITLRFHLSHFCSLLNTLVFVTRSINGILRILH